MRLRHFSSAILALAALLSFASRALAAEGYALAAVVATQPARTTDLVLLDAGYDVGLRLGMICQITRGNLLVGDLLLVELRPTSAAALIVCLTADQAILGGDRVAVKVLKS